MRNLRRTYFDLGLIWLFAACVTLAIAGSIAHQGTLPVTCPAGEHCEETP